ncbi:MAG TPA: oligosaccharide flippase family protein [Verrucomicrobiae bacterium]
MSRLKTFTRSLASGYLQIGVNALYTFASVPLALHYLSTQEFGLWAVAMSVAGYLLLIDFGMTGAAARILIDHKDDPAGGAYGSVIKISIVVLLIQGLAIALIGTAVSFWLPQLVNVPAPFRRTLFHLAAALCVVQGIFFVTRIFWNLCIAHQRYDVSNYAQTGSLIVQFATLWGAFHAGLGIYSLLAAAAVGSLCGFSGGWLAVVRLGFLPGRGRWGRFDRKLFREVFVLGSDQFLMAVGYQLTSASQIFVISKTLSLETAAVWSVATRPFMMAQQLVGRIFSFACSPLAEMIVRNEHERFLKRFRELVIVSAALAIFIASGIAVCNQSFLRIWTKGQIAWNPINDFLFALWFVITFMTGNHVAAVGLTKLIGRMRYVYFVEGILFVALAILAAPRFGIPGIIIAAIVANVLCSGIFGMRRTMKTFRLSAPELMSRWIAGPIIYCALLAAVLVGCWFLTQPLGPILRLALNAILAGVVGLWLLWRLGLSSELRDELRVVAVRARNRFPKIF